MIPFLKTHWRFWITPILLGVGLILFAAILFTSTPSAAKPAVTWTPRSVTQTVGAGETVTVSVSFTASRNLSNVIVRVVPELQPFVVVDPPMLGDIVAGESVSVSMTISIPVSVLPEVFDGTIQLKSGSVPGMTFARPLPVTVAIVWNELDDPALSYSFQHPGNWTANLLDGNAVNLVGQVTPAVPPAPGAMTGVCKVGVRSRDNSTLLPLAEWVAEARATSGAPEPVFSEPVIVSGVEGLKEIVEEIGIITTVYVAQGTNVLSFQFICGAGALEVGQVIFDAILDSLILG